MQSTNTANIGAFYTAREFAALVNLSYPTVLRLIARKKLRVLPYSRHKRIPAVELENWRRGEFI
jgi:excisionase family DNA binding protein